MENLGRAKENPLETALIVCAYLSDNSYSATLASFRTEASNLLSIAYGKKIALKSLNVILDDYICLKKQKMETDREKLRVDAAMKRMQDVIRLYHSESARSVLDLPAKYPPRPTVPLLCALNPKNGSQPDNMNHGVSSFNLKPPLPPPNVSDARFPPPAHAQSYAEKRKASELKEPSPSKKIRTQPPRVSSIVEGIGSSSVEASSAIGKSPVVLKSNDIQPPVNGQSVAKKFFNFLFWH